MKKTIRILTIFLLFLGCKKDDDATVVPPIINGPNDIEDPIEDLPNYVVLDGFIGHWHQSTISSLDGNVIIAGNKRTGGNDHMIVTKTNTNGDVIFSTIFHQQNSNAMGVCEDSQQNIYVVGSAYEESGNENRKLAVAKLDVNGHVIWEHIYHQEENILGRHISALGDNEIIICGSVRGVFDVVFLKIDSLGQEKSFKIIASPGDYKTPSGMLILQDGKILITDYYNNKFNLTWYDQEFNFLWERSYGERHRVCRSAIQLDDESIVTVGKQTHVKEGSSVIDSSKVLILKTDANGELIWEKEVGDTKYLNDGQSIAVNQDGSFVINGYALSDHLNNTDHMIIYVDENGHEINAKYFTDDKTFRGANIIKVENDRNVMTGGYQGGTYFLNVDNYGN